MSFSPIDLSIYNATEYAVFHFEKRAYYSDISLTKSSKTTNESAGVVPYKYLVALTLKCTVGISRNPYQKGSIK